MKLHPMSCGILAAVLFGLSLPLSKLILEESHPLQLSGILYIGGGSCLLIYRSMRRLSGKSSASIRFDRRISWSLGGSILFGGFLAPLAALIGLSTTSAASASLLTNFEAAATVLIAWIVFREYVGKRIAVIAGILTVGAMILSFDPDEPILFSAGAILILLSCVFWGLDNNLSRNLSGGDPSFFVTIKGLVAGSFSFTLSLLLGYGLPSATVLILGVLLGAFAYGLSLVLFMISLREIGTARTGTLFAIAPFIGVAFSFVIFWEMPGLQFAIAFPIMVLGLILLFRESHAHLHAHEKMAHAHLHDHDEHHRHGHKDVSHSHMHEHRPLTHSHTHSPDIHHRHVHGK